MSIDFPRAWQICRSSKIEDHHPKCSWKTHGMLCDCDVVNEHPETKSKTFYGKDGVEIKRDETP